MNVMKGIRQKVDGQYGAMVPFGADGQFIDMFSDLNLEYELKVGPRHLAAIQVISDTLTTVIENYATPDQVATPNEQFYRVKTEIDSTPTPVDDHTVITDVITAGLYWVTVVDGTEDNDIEKLLKIKQSTITEITIDPDPSDPESQTKVSYDIKEVYVED